MRFADVTLPELIHFQDSREDERRLAVGKCILGANPIEFALESPLNDWSRILVFVGVSDFFRLVVENKQVKVAAGAIASGHKDSPTATQSNVVDSRTLVAGQNRTIDSPVVLRTQKSPAKSIDDELVLNQERHRCVDLVLLRQVVTALTHDCDEDEAWPRCSNTGSSPRAADDSSRLAFSKCGF